MSQSAKVTKQVRLQQPFELSRCLTINVFVFSGRIFYRLL